MDETTFIDLTSDPENLPPASPGTIKLQFLIELALGALASAGASGETVLTTFSPCPGVWPIPPRLTYAGRTNITAMAESPSRSVASLLALYRHGRDLVARCGMGPYVTEQLVREFGARVRHPLIFTPSEPSGEAVNLFSLEFILATEGKGSKLVVEGANLVRKFPSKRAGLNQISLIGKDVEVMPWKWVTNKLTAGRGSVVYPTTDVFDRCQVWLENNADPEQCANAMIPLAWLKILQNKTLAYDFEQRLIGLEPAVPEAMPTSFPKLVYTQEALDLARDIWFDTSEDSHTAFREFYSYVVPTYLDDTQFRKIFKTGMVLKEDYTTDIDRKMDAGMLNFAGWFLKTKREKSK